MTGDHNYIHRRECGPVSLRIIFFLFVGTTDSWLLQLCWEPERMFGKLKLIPLLKQSIFGAFPQSMQLRSTQPSLRRMSKSYFSIASNELNYYTLFLKFFLFLFFFNCTVLECGIGKSIGPWKDSSTPSLPSISLRSEPTSTLPRTSWATPPSGSHLTQRKFFFFILF